MPQNRDAVLLGVLGLVAAATASALVLTSDHETQTAAKLVVGELIGLSFVLAGVIGHARRPTNGTGKLLAGVGFAFFAGALAEANSSFLATVGALTGALFLAVFLHLLVAYPTGSLSTSPERRLVATAYTLALVFPLTYVLFARRLEPGCDDCPSNALLVHDSHAVATTIEVVATIAAAVLMLATIVLLVRRWRAASAAYRRSLRPVLFTGAAAVALLLLALVVSPFAPDAVDVVLVALAAAALFLVPFAFLVGLLRPRRAGAAVGRLVASLGPVPAPGHLRDALRQVLGDPTLDLGYWLPDLPGFADIEGRPFDPEEHGAATYVDGETGHIAVLVHDPALLEEPELLDGVVAAARLALENERLHAELRARLNELERERDFTRAVVDTAPAYFCVVDSEGRIVRFNETLAAMTGCTDDERTRGRYLWEVFAVTEEADEIRASLAITAVAGRGEPHEQTLIARDGSRRIVSWSEVVIPDEHGQLRVVLVSGVDVTERKLHEEGVRRSAEEQAALRRVATLVASGPTEAELLAAVTSEIGRLFGAQSANTLRWDGDSIRVVGLWRADGQRSDQIGREYAFGGDTVAARVVTTRAPARIDSRDDLASDFARTRWEELGLHATIGAPIVVDGRLWGVISASRTHPNDPFAPGDENRLGDFAALVSQAFANAEARREVAALAEEQAALRRGATLVAAGRPQPEVVEAVTGEVGRLFDASSVHLMRWSGIHDVCVVLGGWAVGDDVPFPSGSLYRAPADEATLHVLETGLTTAAVETAHVKRAEDDTWHELESQCAVSAPVIVGGSLWGALTALRPQDDPFPPGAEIRLRNFANLIAQSVANAEAREELQASRARIVQAADDARQKLERNLHDGAQQRLVAVSISLRLALAKLAVAPGEAQRLMGAAAEELTQAIEELRELARGIHPAILTDRGLGPALEALARRATLPVDLRSSLDGRLPAPVEAAAYYVVSESLANVAKYAQATEVLVRVEQRNGVARVEVADDGVGGADPTTGSGLRGLADRVEALEGRLGVISREGAGTTVWAEIPCV